MTRGRRWKSTYSEMHSSGTPQEDTMVCQECHLIPVYRIKHILLNGFPLVDMQYNIVLHILGIQRIFTHLDL